MLRIGSVLLQAAMLSAFAGASAPEAGDVGEAAAPDTQTARTGESGHGWGRAPVDTGPACQCRRVALGDATTLPDDGPLIVTGVTDAWPAAYRWRKQDLLRRRGDVLISAAGPSEIAGGVVHDLGARLPLRDFVPLMERHSLFVFDTNASLLHGHDGGFTKYPPAMEPPEGASPGPLAHDIVTPPIFKTFLRGEEYGWNMLSLGGAEEGLGFHVHGASWLGLVYGVKEWSVLRRFLLLRQNAFAVWMVVFFFQQVGVSAGQDARSSHDPDDAAAPRPCLGSSDEAGFRQAPSIREANPLCNTPS